MKRIRQLALLSAGLFGLAVVVSFTTAGPVLAQAFKPVMAFIVNDAAHPVPVIATQPLPVVDAGAGAPFQKFVRSIEPGFAVPEGKRFVIEFYSGTSSTIPSCTLRAMRIRTSLTTESDPVTHTLVPVLTATEPTFNGYTISQQVRLYAGPGTQVAFSITTTPADCAADFLGGVSGHLVDAR
jgi:hypothetical protein